MRFCSKTVIEIDVSRDWFVGFCLPEKQRFRFQNSPDGHTRLPEILQGMPDGLKVGFEVSGGQEWVIWRVLISMGLNTVQLPPAQISARRKQGVSAEPEDMDSSLKAFLESQISELE